MSQLFIQTSATSLYSGLSAAGTSMTITPYPLDIQTQRKLTMADWGTIGYATIDPKVSGYEEIVSFTGVTDNGNNSATLTGLTRNIIGEYPYTTPGTGKTHGSSAVVVFSNNPQLYASLASLLNANTFSALNIFSGYAPQTDTDPVSANDLTRLSYVQALVLGTLTTINVIVPGTAGATLAAGNLVYFDDPTNQWKKCDATSSTTVENVLLGIAQGAGTSGNPITNGVLLQGVDSHQTGLTDGQTMYASNTPGAISSSAGTITVVVGISKGTTQLYFSPRFNEQVTQKQINALAGNGGTPDTGNKYVTQNGLQAGSELYIADASGSTTAYTATLSPAISAYTTGMEIRVKIGLSNTTTTPTLNVNGLGAKTIVKQVSTALAVGDIGAGQFCIFMYDGTNMVLIKSSAFVSATDVQTFSGNGTWNKPAGAVKVRVQAWGGGGGGGGAISTATGAGGGAGGSYAEWTFEASDLSSSETVVVGAGGAGGGAGNNNGVAGTNSTFSSTKVIAYGGGFGTFANAGSGGGAGGGGGNVAVGSNASGSTGGSGGGQSGGAHSAVSVFGGGGGGSFGESGGLSTNGGGGGGGGNNVAALAGGSSFFGGGGGSGGGTGGGIAGGTSVRGGNGGTSGGTSSAGGNGVIPAGGGGGAHSTSGNFAGGNGADGKVIITTFF